jgi:hypothetical protein
MDELLRLMPFHKWFYRPVQTAFGEGIAVWRGCWRRGMVYKCNLLEKRGVVPRRLFLFIKARFIFKFLLKL